MRCFANHGLRNVIIKEDIMEKSDEEIIKILEIIQQPLHTAIMQIYDTAKTGGFKKLIRDAAWQNKNPIFDQLLVELKRKNVLIDDNFKRILSKIKIHITSDFFDGMIIRVSYKDDDAQIEHGLYTGFPHLEHGLYTGFPHSA